MYQYKYLSKNDVHRIEEIDAEWFIHKAWRQLNGDLALVEINYVEKELPNGLPWHKEHYLSSLHGGGKAIGCFKNDIMVGYAVLNGELFHRLCQCALKLGAKKLYICSASAEETVTFYRNLGCIDAIEVNKELYALDPRDLQLEYPIHRWRH
nr:hypothetical protein [uncultured Lachnoclostridium sp.]